MGSNAVYSAASSGAPAGSATAANCGRLRLRDLSAARSRLRESPSPLESWAAPQHRDRLGLMSRLA